MKTNGLIKIDNLSKIDARRKIDNSVTIHYIDSYQEIYELWMLSFGYFPSSRISSLFLW